MQVRRERGVLEARDPRHRGTGPAPAGVRPRPAAVRCGTGTRSSTLARGILRSSLTEDSTRNSRTLDSPSVLPHWWPIGRWGWKRGFFLGDTPLLSERHRRCTRELSESCFDDNTNLGPVKGSKGYSGHPKPRTLSAGELGSYLSRCTGRMRLY